MRSPWLPLYASIVAVVGLLLFPAALATVCTGHGCFVRISPYAVPFGVLEAALILFGVSLGTWNAVRRIRPLWTSIAGIVISLGTAVSWVLVFSTCVPKMMR